MQICMFYPYFCTFSIAYCCIHTGTAAGIYDLRRLQFKRVAELDGAARSRLTVALFRIGQFTKVQRIGQKWHKT